MPAHEGSKGNEFANKVVKRAQQKEITVWVPLGKAEVKAVIKKTGVERKSWRKTRGYNKLQKTCRLHDKV